jgi:Flp pilus assembly pilin Flp
MVECIRDSDISAVRPEAAEYTTLDAMHDRSDPLSELMMQKYHEVNNWVESFKHEEGQTLAEYALLLALIAILIIAALAALRGSLEGIFTRITAALG